MDRSKVKKVIFVTATFLLFLIPANAATKKNSNSSGFSGILYGHIHDLRPDFSAITVKPIDPNDRRHRVSIDSKTRVYVNKKRRSAKALYLGDKVAVRYFGRGTTIIADAIYVVFGDFVPKDYIVKKRLSVIKKDSKETNGAEAGYGGEEKSSGSQKH